MLDAGVLRRLEAAFSRDFSSVRFFVDPHATSMGAEAYTQGRHIYMAPDRFRPNTREGQELLGHELTHVIQQAQGRVHSTRPLKDHGFSDDVSLEREADQMGKLVATRTTRASVVSHLFPNLLHTPRLPLCAGSRPSVDVPQSGPRSLQPPVQRQIGLFNPNSANNVGVVIVLNFVDLGGEYWVSFDPGDTVQTLVTYATEKFRLVPPVTVFLRATGQQVPPNTSLEADTVYELRVCELRVPQRPPSGVWPELPDEWHGPPVGDD